MFIHSFTHSFYSFKQQWNNT